MEISESLKIDLGNVRYPMIIRLAVDLLTSTNGCTVDLDQPKQFQIFYSALRTKGTLAPRFIGAKKRRCLIGFL